MTSCERELKTNDQPDLGQLTEVEGMVLFPDGDPFPAALIRVEGQDIETLTNAEGKFKLRAPSRGKLVIGFEGYRSMTIPLLENEVKNAAISITLHKQTEAEARSTQDPALKAVAGRDSIFTVIEKHPEFPGGVKAMYSYVKQHLKYPQRAIDAQVEGKVFLRFVVGADGQIRDIQVQKGLGFGMDEEAIRLVSTMPHWKPGSQDGQAKNVRFNLPITFQLGELRTN
ncbi:hypothetical protein GCM10027275_29890 [Rhabdobacter roseus]